MKLHIIDSSFQQKNKLAASITLRYFLFEVLSKRFDTQLTGETEALKDLLGVGLTKDSTISSSLRGSLPSLSAESREVLEECTDVLLLLYCWSSMLQLPRLPVLSRERYSCLWAGALIWVPAGRLSE